MSEQGRGGVYVVPSREAIDKLNEAVDLFASAMKAKLMVKASQGFAGWDEPESIERVKSMLHEHAGRLFIQSQPQEIDIANLAMMLWWHRNEPRLRAIYDADVRGGGDTIDDQPHG